MFKILLFFFIAVPCWLILFKNRTDKECAIIGIVVTILQMAFKYLLP